MSRAHAGRRPARSRCARITLKKIHFRDERKVQNPLLETAAFGQSLPMAAVPRTGPGCLGSPPAQAPSSSLAGVQGAPKRLGVSKPSWIVRTEVLVSPNCPARCSVLFTFAIRRAPARWGRDVAEPWLP
jgi:hypothetical protein